MAASPGAEDLIDRVQAEIDSFVAAQRDRLADAGPEAAALIDAARRSVSGGKRLRAAYCYWGWRAAGGSSVSDRPIVAGAALEWLQASALVHDDVIDESATRRGRPAAHRAFAAQHEERAFRGDSLRFGVGAAVLLGDLMLSWADEMFRAAATGDSATSAAGHFDACKSEVVAGQFLDVVAEAAADPTVESAMRVVRFKAAKYTVERPLLIGAALAGADPALSDALSGFGLPVGEAFQLRDDLLGAFGDASVTGKPAGDDLRSGKRTVLVARAYEHADAAQRRLLDAMIGNPTLTADDVDRVREVLRSTGALAAVEAQIDGLYDTALRVLDPAPLADDDARKALITLAERSIRRDR
ncbi:MAG TPA: polyprenyl synthetase family protein [Nocardioidaceae bacterium]|nr:polyprenyl synthetase family protein [Nocardioidaceae bacterium]